MRRRVLRLMFVSMAGLVALCMTACQDKSADPKSTGKVIVAKRRATTTQLYYEGSLAPKSAKLVLSPDNGTVKTLNFKYGSTVVKHQKLVTIAPTTLEKDYRQAVSAYLQKKSASENAKKTYEADNALYKAGVISEQDFINGRNAYETSHLDFFQSRYRLEKVLNKAGVSIKRVEALSYSDADKIETVLKRKFNEVVIYSSETGVALFPSRSQNQSSQSNGKIKQGALVKENQLLLSIGDLTGFRIHFKVSEVDVNKMKVGLKAKVTGSAFEGIILKGHVDSVASQANPGGDSGDSPVSMFNVSVVIPVVTKEQQKIIRVGMTAKVKISIQDKPHVILPIKAIFIKNGKPMVTLVDSKTGEHKEVPVVTGETNVGSVIILRGVSPGDRVWVDD